MKRKSRRSSQKGGKPHTKPIMSINTHYWIEGWLPFAGAFVGLAALAVSYLAFAYGGVAALAGIAVEPDEGWIVAGIFIFIPLGIVCCLSVYLHIPARCPVCQGPAYQRQINLERELNHILIIYQCQCCRATMKKAIRRRDRARGRTGHVRTWEGDGEVDKRRR